MTGFKSWLVLLFVVLIIMAMGLMVYTFIKMRQAKEDRDYLIVVFAAIACECVYAGFIYGCILLITVLI